MGFNKTPDPGKVLHFLDQATIEKLAEQHGMTLEVLFEKKTTSNKLIKIVRGARST
jgi:hypothetical protein